MTIIGYGMALQDEGMVSANTGSDVSLGLLALSHPRQGTSRNDWMSLEGFVISATTGQDGYCHREDTVGLGDPGAITALGCVAILAPADGQCNPRQPRKQRQGTKIEKKNN